MYLEKFNAALVEKWDSSLFKVSSAKELDARGKEYLHRLEKLGKVKKVYWGWYYIPGKKMDVWDFLTNDKGFKVLIKQTAASLWDYDFIHRDIYRLAVENQSYKKALESFACEVGWTFEVECYDKVPYDYKMVDGLLIESPESCIISCTSDWAFTDAFATLYFRRDEINFEKLKELSRWKRISKVDTRVWTAIKYSCKLFNEQLNKTIFKVKTTEVREDLKELIEEAVEKVIEFA